MLWQVKHGSGPIYETSSQHFKRLSLSLWDNVLPCIITFHRIIVHLFVTGYSRLASTLWNGLHRPRSEPVKICSWCDPVSLQVLSLPRQVQKERRAQSTSFPRAPRQSWSKFEENTGKIFWYRLKKFDRQRSNKLFLPFCSNNGRSSFCKFKLWWNTYKIKCKL